MKSRLLLSVALVLISRESPLYAQAAAPSAAQSAHSDALRRDIDEARLKVYPALVNITVVTRYFQGGRALRAPAGGSGVIVSPEGHVLTNFHVAGHTTRITCTLPSGEALDASVVCDDPLTDLSILKLHTEKRTDNAPLPYARLGDSSALQVGEHVLAMGNPQMLSSSVTLGIVSNTKRVFTDFVGTEIEDQELEGGEKTGIFTRWIQHDALILPGNSGGPLVNLRGEVVGINELGGSGVGFAIPSNIAAEVLRQAVQFGRVKRGWLGFSAMPVGRLGRKDGALISSISPESPAAKAGLKAGDILLAIDGRPVTVRFFEEVPLLYQRIAALVAGAKVQLAYLRGSDQKSTAATVATMEKSLGDEEEVRKMGVSVQEITRTMATTMKLPSREGVMVTGLRVGYPFEAAQPKMAAGDVIVSVNGKPTANLEGFRTTLATESSKEFPVVYRRSNEELVSIVKVTEETAQDEGQELPKPWLGIKTQVLTPELAAALHVAGSKGFRVTEVFPATSAGKAGLKAGDIITALNGRKLTAYRAQDEGDLKSAVEDLTIGDKAKLTLLRNGAPATIQIPLQEPPPSAEKAKKSKQKEFEFSVRDISDLDRFENRWTPSQAGALVTDVTQGGWAQMAGLRSDDLITEIGGQPVADLAAFDRILATIIAAKPKVIKIFVIRGSQTHFVFIEPDWTKLQSGL